MDEEEEEVTERQSVSCSPLSSEKLQAKPDNLCRNHKDCGVRMREKERERTAIRYRCLLWALMLTPGVSVALPDLNRLTTEHLDAAPCDGSSRLTETVHVKLTM